VVGGVLGFSESEFRRFMKDLMVESMESERVLGREEMRSEEGLIEWIRVLRMGFEDFRVSFVAKVMNSCGED
jgi:hypothetical protein